MRFSDSFVLQGHGVSPSGRVVWPCLCAAAAAVRAMVFPRPAGLCGRVFLQQQQQQQQSSSSPLVAWAAPAAAAVVLVLQ